MRARLVQRRRRCAVCKHWAAHECRVIGAKPQDHDPQFLVGEIFVQRRNHDAALDVRFDHRHSPVLTDVRERDVREVSGVVVPARDERARRRAATRHEQVAGAHAHTADICRRASAWLIGAGRQRKRVGWLHLEEQFLDRRATPVEQAVEAVAARGRLRIPHPGRALHGFSDPLVHLGQFRNAGRAGAERGCGEEEGSLELVERGRGVAQHSPDEPSVRYRWMCFGLVHRVSR